MMNPVSLKSRVGPDGILTVSVPLGEMEANREVQVTVEPVLCKPGMDRAAWLKFIAETAGSIPDPSFQRQPQGDYEDRAELP